MGLIKSPDVPASVRVFSMQDIELAAKRLLTRARQQADSLLLAAREEAERLKEKATQTGVAEGRQHGHAAGLEEGKKSGHAQALAENTAAMKQLINSLTDAMRQLEQSREQLRTQAVNEVVALACSIARKVTKRQGAIDQQVLGENIKQALALAVHAADVRISVNPAQLKTLKDELPNLRMSWPQLSHVELSEDAKVSPGGARIFTRHGKIDGDLDAQLDHIIAELLPAEMTEAK
jgi:flagellar assembly protein FliH